MANYCISDIEISGSKQDIDTLMFHLNKAMEKGSCDDWIGNYLEYLNIDTNNECRGFVLQCYPSSTFNTINMTVESAWSPQLEPIYLMVKKYAPNCDIKFYAEEESISLYIANDERVGDVIVNLYDDDAESKGTEFYETFYDNRYFTEQDFINNINRIAKSTFTTFEQAEEYAQGFIEQYNEDNDTDICLEINRVEYVPLEHTF